MNFTNKFNYIDIEDFENTDLSEIDLTTLDKLINDSKTKNYKIDYFIVKDLFDESKVQFIINYLTEHNMYNEDSFMEDFTEIDSDISLDNIEESELDSTSDLFKIYMKDVSKYSLLSAEEENELFKKYSNGDKKAKTTIINHNLRLVISVAKRYRYTGLAFMDLIQFGNLGLIKAVEKFNLDLGHRFSTYATWWIKQSIIRGITNDSRSIRLPVHIVEQGQKITRAIENLKSKNGKEPSEQEIAEYINKTKQYSESSKDYMTAKRVKIYMDFYNLGSVVSLDTPLVNKDGDDSDSLGDLIASTTDGPEDVANDNDMTTTINDVISQYLSERQAEVLYYRFGLNGYPTLTLEQIGKIYGVSRERIRQIEFKALSRLKKNWRARKALINYIK